jgi:uncharacterized membrane protein (GlpM family)
MDKVIAVLAIKALAGGAFVVLFSLIAEVLRPKSFSGLFSAAPSVAIAGLLVTSLTASPEAGGAAAHGMIAGAVAMVACCAAAAFLVHRFGGLVGTALTWAVWGLVAAVLYLELVA